MGLKRRNVEVLDRLSEVSYLYSQAGDLGLSTFKDVSETGNLTFFDGDESFNSSKKTAEVLTFGSTTESAGDDFLDGLSDFDNISAIDQDIELSISWEGNIDSSS